MDEPRDLTHDALAAAMRRSYEINVSAIEFLPGGEDTNAWVYRVDAEDASAARTSKGCSIEAESSNWRSPPTTEEGFG